MSAELLRELLADAPSRLWALGAAGVLQPDLTGAANLTLTAGVTDSLFRGQRAKTLDANGDYGSHTHLASPLGTREAWSYGAWVRTTSADAVSAYEGNPAQTILGDTNNSVCCNFGIHGGKVAWHVAANNAANWAKAWSATSVNDGQWRYIGCTYDGTAAGAGNVQMLIDGNVDLAVTLAVNGLHGTTQLGTNTMGNGYNLLDGFLGDVAWVWCKKGAVVAPARYLAHYRAGARAGVTY